MRTLSFLIGCGALMIVAGIGAARARASAAPVPARHVVLAELFTSEGCSSCPPADALLRDISAQAPLAGVEVLGLEEHVDYWDNLGWRDPFSSAAFTRRQSDYAARVFRFGEIYTPQLVVDGAFEAIGSDSARVRDAIERAAARPAAAVGVAATGGDARVHVDVTVTMPPSVDSAKAADILVALVEDGLTSHVERGENHGRTLPHAGVVRALRVAGALQAKAATGAAAADFTLDQGWQPSHLRVVAFVQQRSTLRVLGSGVAAIDGRR